MKGIPGFWLKRAALASAALCAFAGPAHSREAIRVEAGTLAGAVIAIARETGVEIVSVQPGLGLVPVRARKLDADPARALTALLRGTAWRAVRLGPASFRIERAPPSVHAVHRAARPDAAAPADAPITVVAGKFPTRIADYPGSVMRLPAQGSTLPPGTTQLADLARRSPVVFATAFGDGRDKLFVRGIADSSFNGASLPTTAIYFDDAPVSFGSPNPNLRLYDVASVEVLEGPQGTLYGGGSIGGVIRITPRPVDLARAGQWGLAEGRFTAAGQPGWKVAAALNLPIAKDVAGLRLTAFNERQGGYIDDANLSANANRVDVTGARAALAAHLAPGFTLDLGGLYQTTSARDAQYADTSGAWQRAALLMQPYGSEIVLGRAALRKRWDSGLELVSVFSIGHRASTDRFDASGDPVAMGATAYDLQRSSTMLTNETRLSRATASGVSWVAGIGVDRLSDGQSRAFGMPSSLPVLDEVTNITRSASLFVQGRAPVSPALAVTLGLRYTMARTDSEPSRGRIVSYIRGESANHFDPTLALLWRAAPRLSLFGRFQTSYRNGGVTVARGVGRVADFAPDSIVMAETGFRLLPAGSHGLELSGALSAARWTNVLAELVTPRGTPITSNIGDARILALEGTADWSAASGWRLGGSFLYSANRTTGDLAAQTPQANRRLPDTPAFSGEAHASYEWRGPGGFTHTASTSARYVGRSLLGPGPQLDISQGDYAVVDAALESRRGPLALWLSVENLLNASTSRFALGNPLLLARRQGRVPLAPRTLALGISLSR